MRLSSNLIHGQVEGILSAIILSSKSSPSTSSLSSSLVIKKLHHNVQVTIKHLTTTAITKTTTTHYKKDRVRNPSKPLPIFCAKQLDLACHGESCEGWRRSLETMPQKTCLSKTLEHLSAMA